MTRLRARLCDCPYHLMKQNWVIKQTGDACNNCYLIVCLLVYSSYCYFSLRLFRRGEAEISLLRRLLFDGFGKNTTHVMIKDHIFS